MKLSSKWLTIFMMLLLGLNCTPKVNVKYDFLKDTDFSRFKTFTFMDIPENIQIRTYTLKEIKSHTTTVLKQKGLSQSSESPDLLVAIHTELSETKSIANWGYTYAPNNMYWAGPDYWGGKSIDTYYAGKGTLILDFAKADSKELIWRGIAETALHDHPNVDKISEIVEKAVHIMLENYPPKDIM